MAWSSGKDSSMALARLKADENIEVVALLTTVSEEYSRICMHGVRTTLLEAQAAATGLPLEKVPVLPKADNAAYDAVMHKTLCKYKDLGVEAVAFGDLFLEDIRKYREERLSLAGLHGIFPLWGEDTTGLSRSFIKNGFKAIITCVDTKALDKNFAGMDYGAAFLGALPKTVDPCGENGEFHTFCYSGPVFSWPIEFTHGESVLRDDRFYYHDLLEAQHD